MLDTMSGMKLFSSLGSGKKLSFLKFSIVLVIVGFVGYFGIYKTIAVKQEKDRFLKAQASLEDLSKQIEAKIGKPDQIKRDRSCGYSSPFSMFDKRGYRSCFVGVYILYENKGLEDANSKMSQISPLISAKLYPGAGEKYQKEFIPVTQNNHQSFSQDYKNFGEISCSVSYSYPQFPTFSTDTFQTTFKENFQVILSCGGDARAE